MGTSTVANLLAVAAITVNVCGFYFVTGQISSQALATRGDTYANLCGLSLVPQDFMTEYKKWNSPEVGEILDEAGAVGRGG